MRKHMLTPEERALRKSECGRHYYAVNAEQIKARQRRWNAINTMRRRVYAQRRRAENIKMTHEQDRKKYRKLMANPQAKLAFYLRNSIKRALKGNLTTGSAVRLLECSTVEAIAFIESKFQPGMTWNNWAQSGWHVDHKRPLASFDLTDPAQLAEACHYTNLQPLWYRDNLSKGAKWPQWEAI